MKHDRAVLIRKITGLYIIYSCTSNAKCPIKHVYHSEQLGSGQTFTFTNRQFNFCERADPALCVTFAHSIGWGRRAFQSILNGNQEKECIRQQFYATARFLITTNKNIDNHQGPSEQVCHFSEAELEDWNSSAHSDLSSSNFSQAPRRFYFLSRDLVFRVLLLCGHRDQPLIIHRSPRTVHWEQTSNEYF